MAISLTCVSEQNAQECFRLHVPQCGAEAAGNNNQLNGEIEESLKAAESLHSSALSSTVQGQDLFAAAAAEKGLAAWFKNNMPSWLLKLISAASQAPSSPAEHKSINRASQETAYAADILADDQSLWQRHQFLKKETLQEIVNSPQRNAPDTVRAARLLLANPQAFNKIDGANTGGKTDGLISRHDLVQYGKIVTMETPAAVLPVGMPGPTWQRSANAANVLADDPDLWRSQNYLDIGDLKDIVAHPSQHPPVTVAAAQTMLDHPSHFSLADGQHTNGRVDGEVWRQDLVKFAKSVNDGVRKARFEGSDESQLEAFMEKALAAATARALQHAENFDAAIPLQDALEQQRLGDAQRARQTLLNDTDLLAGKSALTMQDLQDVLMDPYGHEAETVSAALFVLQNPDAMMDD